MRRSIVYLVALIGAVLISYAAGANATKSGTTPTGAHNIRIAGNDSPDRITIDCSGQALASVTAILVFGSVIALIIQRRRKPIA
jgi:hypothetical protein